MLEYLIAKGFNLTITALKCDHSVMTTSGNVSEHSSGDAVDIATIDGVPVNGHQGPGTLTDALIKDVLQLQGTMHPHQVISLEDLPGTTSFALPDHYDHVHIGYYPAYETAYVSPFLNATAGRIDQGVDFTGIGPIAAVGDARILQTGAPGWPEGGGVLYQLLDGPRAGQIVFVYEGVEATVQAGDRVSAGQRIGTFVAGGSIEMGFADANGVPLSHAEYVEGKETRGVRRWRPSSPASAAPAPSPPASASSRRKSGTGWPDVSAKSPTRRCRVALEVLAAGRQGQGRAPAAPGPATDPPADQGESGFWPSSSDSRSSSSPAPSRCPTAATWRATAGRAPSGCS